MNRIRLLFFLIVSCLACQKETSNPVEILVPETPKPPLPPGWLVYPDSIKNGGPGKDGIVSIDKPNFLDADEVSFLELDELVLGVKIGDEARAYPHRILDYHELVNDQIDQTPFTLTFAPLTGSGVGWERTIADGVVTTFGSSGLLYQNNLVPYDRETGSIWSQFRLDCVNGKLLGEKLQPISVVETTWRTWQRFFPGSKVMNIPTGFNRNYSNNLFADYKMRDDYFLFPVAIAPSHLSNKERVLGVVVNGKAHIYPFSSMSKKPKNYWVYNDDVDGVPVVVAGNYEQNFLVAFNRKLADGTILYFNPLLNKGATILRDQEGTLWNIFGEAVRGPRKGQRLSHINAFIGYWFAWSIFYPDAIVK
jgi:hypothetical protein